MYTGRLEYNSFGSMSSVDFRIDVDVDMIGCAKCNKEVCSLMRGQG